MRFYFYLCKIEIIKYSVDLLFYLFWAMAGVKYSTLTHTSDNCFVVSKTSAPGIYPFASNSPYLRDFNSTVASVGRPLKQNYAK